MNWKAYDEVHFSDQYILRWVREGDEYVSRISKEMMEDLHSVVRQQQAEIGFYKQDADRYKLKCASQQTEIDALKKTIESLFGGLESSLALNKAQTERN
jgi:hypothetical protein